MKQIVKTKLKLNTTQNKYGLNIVLVKTAMGFCVGFRALLGGLVVLSDTCFDGKEKYGMGKKLNF